MLPSVKLNQSGTRPVLGEHNSRMVGADNVRVRIAPPDPIRTTNTWYVLLVLMSNIAHDYHFSCRLWVRLPNFIIIFRLSVYKSGILSGNAS